MATVKELLEKRANLVAQGRALVDTADTEKRELSAEEAEQYERIFAEVKEIKASVERHRQLEDEERLLDTLQGDAEKPPLGDGESRDAKSAAYEGRSGLLKYLRGNISGMTDVERRALSADSDIAGGFLRAPLAWRNELIQGLDDLMYMRQICNVQPPVTDAEGLGVPTLENDIDDAEWTHELSAGDADNSMDFGKRELHPHPLARYIKVSNKLLRATGNGIDRLVRERLAYKLAKPMENGYINGTGSGAPLGMMVASDDGVPTSRDVSDGNSETAPTFDGLKSAMWSLKAPYRKNAVWMFHTDSLSILSKIKGADGHYIWSESVRDGEPDKLNNRPIYESPFMPNTFTTGKYVGMLFDPRFYWIVDSLGVEIQRLNELFALTGRSAFLGRVESDGMPVLAEAFARVTLA